MPTGNWLREGQSEAGNNPRGEPRKTTEKYQRRSIGVVSTARREGDLRQERKPGAGNNGANRATAGLGLGEGHSSEEAG
jgi:hypothetical protein